MQDISLKLKEFTEQEARLCSKCISPEYVYRMWGGSVDIEEIASPMEEVRSHR